MIPSFVCIFLVLFSSGLALAAPDRIRERVDLNRVTVVPGHVHSGSRMRDDRGPVVADLPISYMTVLLKPDASLEAFLAEQRTPSSPMYHKWLSPQQFGDRFGASSKDLQSVTAWLGSQGLQVHDVARGGLWVTFSGTAGKVERALHTKFRKYQWSGKVHFAASIEPSVPDALLPVIAGFDGLDDFGANLARHTLDEVPNYTSGGTHYLAPDDIATIYNTVSLYAAGFDGTGQKIAIVGRTALDLADVRAFRSRFNLPPNDPQVVLFGADPGVLSTDELSEANLDLEWSGAIARNATIVYVYSSNTRTSAQYAVDKNVAPVMSYSFGSCEPGVNSAFRAVAQQANAQGITFVVASGDGGAATCDYLGSHAAGHKRQHGQFSL